MSWRRSITVWCDECGESDGGDLGTETVAEMRGDLRAHGWVHLNGRDLCDGCKEETADALAEAVWAAIVRWKRESAFDGTRRTRSEFVADALIADGWQRHPLCDTCNGTGVVAHTPGVGADGFDPCPDCINGRTP